jgi:hypothetical protein
MVFSLSALLLLFDGVSRPGAPRRARQWLGTKSSRVSAGLILNLKLIGQCLISGANAAFTEA